MPFQDDSGVRLEEHPGLLWSPFATLADQVERFVVVNVAWSVQLFPAIVTLAFPSLPLWIRVALFAYTVIALVPATAVLYGLVALGCEGELLRVSIATELLRKLTIPSLQSLMPLLSTFGLLGWARAWANSAGIVAIDALAQLLLMLSLVCATYWGPLLVEAPEQSPAAILRQSVTLVFRYPAQTLLTCGAVLLTTVVGTLSVGGLVLIVPVLIALFQTQLYRHVAKATGGVSSQ